MTLIFEWGISANVQFAKFIATLKRSSEQHAIVFNFESHRPNLYILHF